LCYRPGHNLRFNVLQGGDEVCLADLSWAPVPWVFLNNLLSRATIIEGLERRAEQKFLCRALCDITLTDRVHDAILREKEPILVFILVLDSLFSQKRVLGSLDLLSLRPAVQGFYLDGLLNDVEQIEVGLIKAEYLGSIDEVKGFIQ